MLSCYCTYLHALVERLFARAARVHARDIVAQSHRSPPQPGLYRHFPLLDTALAEMAGKIRNPKSETNSNEQRSRSRKPSRRGRADWSGFETLSFEFGACFGFRVS